MKSGFANPLISLALAMMLHPSGANAQSIAINPRDPLHQIGPATIPCVITAAVRHGVPANVLLALASLEGGKNGQLVRNTNGSYDVGHFQINTIHFGEKGVFNHIRKDDAAWRGCFNAEMAAWFLRQRLDAPTGGDYWARVATYHSATPKYNSIYRSKLIPLSARWGRWLQANYTTSTSYH